MMTVQQVSLVCVAVLTAAVAGSVFAQAKNDDWIAREKIRAGWIYHGDGVDKIKVFKDVGMNALVTSARNREQFDEWAKESRRVGMHLFGVLGFSFDAEKAGMRRAVFGNGYESVVACPTDERFWQEQMIQPAVELAKEGMTPEKEISGILIDFELYANSNKGGQIYYTDACYCDHCFGGFLKHKGLDDVTKTVPFAERKKWLTDKGVDIEKEYHPFLQKQVRALATKMREEVEKVRKDFFVGFYPIPHNWMLVGTAQGLGTPEHPMILWATTTYGGGGPDKVEDNWRDLMKEKEINCYYCAGMLLRFYTSPNLAKNMYEIAKKSDGYWLFTVHTVCISEDEQNGDYYLASGTPEDYLREIKRADEEIDKLCADPNYKTSLTYVEEPVLYRQTGYDIGRFRPPKVADKSEVERGKEMAVDPLPFIGANYVMTNLAEGEEAALRFQADQSKSQYVWGVSYAVIDAEKKIVTKGHLPPGEETVVKFKAPKAGLYTVVVTAGYYGRCTLLSTTVPYALWTGSNFEISRPGGTIYFLVPEGLKEFDLSAQCHWGTNAVKLTVCDPDGKVAKEQETDPFVRSAKITIPTEGKCGKLWSLKVEAVPKQSYRSVFIKFDKKLPPMVTVSPRFVFTNADK